MTHHDNYVPQTQNITFKQKGSMTLKKMLCILQRAELFPRMCSPIQNSLSFVLKHLFVHRQTGYKEEISKQAPRKHILQ